MNLISGFKQYLIIVILSGITTFGLYIFYIGVKFAMKQMGFVDSTTFLSIIELAFRITLFVTLSPVGLLVLFFAVFGNPIMDITVFLINSGGQIIDMFLPDTVIDPLSGKTATLFKWSTLTWTDFDTTEMMNDYQTFAEIIKGLLFPDIV